MAQPLSRYPMGLINYLFSMKVNDCILAENIIVELISIRVIYPYHPKKKKNDGVGSLFRLDETFPPPIEQN